LIYDIGFETGYTTQQDACGDRKNRITKEEDMLTSSSKLKK